MKWLIYLAGISVGFCAGFFVGSLRNLNRMDQQKRKTQMAIQELQALRGEMHATQQELWQR